MSTQASYRSSDPKVAVYQGPDASKESSDQVLRKIVEGVSRALKLGGNSVIGVISPVKLTSEHVVEQLMEAHGDVFDVIHSMPDLIVLLTKDKASSLAIRMLFVGGDDSRGEATVTVEHNNVVEQVVDPVTRSASPTSVASDQASVPKSQKTTTSPEKPNSKATPQSKTNNNTSAIEPTEGARVIVAFDQDNLDVHLNSAIVEVCKEAIQNRGIFTVAISGDDIPALLGSIEKVFDDQGVDPQLNKWHVLLANEKCVPLTNKDSNLNSLMENVLVDFEVPTSQVYGINQSRLSDGPKAVADDYEDVVNTVLAKSGGHLDLAVLGYGADGHTCGLLPGHALLEEDEKLVAATTDSITFTLPIFQNMTRHVIICGGGSSKGPVLRNVFKALKPSANTYTVPRGAVYSVTLDDEPMPQYPCSLAVPTTPLSTLTWVVDAEAMSAAKSAPSPY